MTTDDVILLIQTQWERGLIVPVKLLDTELGQACRQALLDGACVGKPYSMPKHCDSICYVLSRQGWLRYAELIGGAEVVFS